MPEPAEHSKKPAQLSAVYLEKHGRSHPAFRTVRNVKHASMQLKRLRRKLAGDDDVWVPNPRRSAAPTL